MNKELLEILNIVLSNAGLENISELDNNLNLRNDLGLDSINLAELTVRIDEKFGIDVFESGSVETIGQIISKLSTIKA